ncbi:MAG: hypothetical protein M3Y84_10255 [Acidobacteriota bacterium]|nr:hypothetical protein [Acidobacteriota bacterium]
MSNRQMKWVHWSKSIVWVCQLILWVAGATSLFAQDATTQSAGGTGKDAHEDKLPGKV